MFRAFISAAALVAFAFAQVTSSTVDSPELLKRQVHAAIPRRTTQTPFSVAAITTPAASPTTTAAAAPTPIAQSLSAGSGEKRAGPRDAAATEEKQCSAAECKSSTRGTAEDAAGGGGGDGGDKAETSPCR